MNILLIIHEKNLNGASKSILNLIDELGGRHTFYVVSPYNEGPVAEELKTRGITVFYHPIKRWVRKMPESTIRWKAIRIKWATYNRFYNLWQAVRLSKEIKDLRIDLIHTNTSVVNLGALLTGITGIPHVWHIREFGKEDFDLYPLVGERKFFEVINQRSVQVIAVSNALAAKYRPHINEGKLKTIHNGVGRENLYEHCEYKDDGPFEFLISGTIQPGKGMDVAVKAAGELVRRGIRNFRLSVAGAGEDGWLKDLFQGQDAYVRFLGRVSDMPTLRKKMDVELVCSRCEAFGRVTAEGMMGGLPVIGSNTGGTLELIRDGETGLLFRQGDYMELADKMEYLIRTPGEIMRMGLNAQKYASGHFSIERCAAEVEEVYRTAKLFGGCLLGGGGKRVAIAWNVYDDSRAHLVYGGAAA